MKLRWFAIVHKRTNCGYAIDYYPNEKAACENQYGESIIGDFATRAEAHAAINEALDRSHTMKKRKTKAKPRKTKTEKAPAAAKLDTMIDTTDMMLQMISDTRDDTKECRSILEHLLKLSIQHSGDKQPGAPTPQSAPTPPQAQPGFTIEPPPFMGVKRNL